MVAVPRRDFLQDMEGGFRNAAGLGLLAARGVALIGLAVMGVLTREMNALAAAVKRISDGDLSTPLSSSRNDARSNDLGARFAGDEFVVLLESVGNRVDAESARAHIEACLRKPLQALSAHDPAATEGGACGLAVFPADGKDVQTLLKAADEDMDLRKPRI